MVNVAIGQGYLTLNVVQANKIISIIANDGEFVPYKLFDSTNQLNSKKLKIKPKNLRVIKDGLLGVVNDSNGTGFHARDDLLLAGKTEQHRLYQKILLIMDMGNIKIMDGLLLTIPLMIQGLLLQFLLNMVILVEEQVVPSLKK